MEIKPDTTTAQPPYQPLLQALTEGVTVITPNRRLAAGLQRLYAVHIAQEAWLTPDILPLSAWLNRIAQTDAMRHFESCQLLNESQELALWEKILQNSAELYPLLAIPETAKIAQSAFRRLREALVDPTTSTTWSIHHPIPYDYDIFYQWCKTFQSYCERNTWLDAATLPDVLYQKMKDRVITIHQKIILVGFIEIEPQIKRLFDACGAHYYTPPERACQVQRIVVNHEEEVYFAMARWAKTLLEAHPTSRIGCVLPTLQKKRARIEQIFSHFIPSSDINISAGIPLKACPVVQTALQLLGLYRRTVSVEVMQSLLYSPFIGDAEKEFTQRIKYHNMLQEKGHANVALPSPGLLKNCPQLHHRISLFLKKLNRSPKIQSHDHWAITFAESLSCLGWPGERSIDSEEHQATQQLITTALDELVSLDSITPKVTLDAAYEALVKIAGRKIFHAKTPDAPIQILGTLEAAGLPFDYLWVAGVDDLTWPAKPKPHAFIPKALQREKSMPHATFEREMSYSRALLNQFEKTADHLILSHHCQQGEMTVEASPLITHYPIVPLDFLPQDSTPLAAEKIFASKDIELIADQQVHLPVLQETQTGGVRLIQDQAQCPFKAFAIWRLHARSAKKPSLGFKREERGVLIHQLLATLWQRIKTQAALQDLSASSLHEMIQESIEQTFERFIHDKHPLSKQKRYLHIEKKRCYSIVKLALQHDQARLPFEVLACEEAVEMHLGSLRLNGRIDRIDIIDNKKIIIDYKTGKQINPNAWFDERIDEPQLPLYALHEAESVGGIAFFQVTPSAARYRGVAAEEVGITGVETLPAWQHQQTLWRHTLEQLAQDFCNGIATVDPKDPDETCQYCELKPLCRVGETIC